MSDKEVMIDNDYEEEEEGENGEKTSQEVTVLPIDSLVSKEEMTSSTAATNEEIALSSTNQLPTNGYSGEQSNQMYWRPLYQQQTNDNNGNQFQSPITTPPPTGNLQMAPQPTGCVLMPPQPNASNEKIALSSANQLSTNGGYLSTLSFARYQMPSQPTSRHLMPAPTGNYQIPPHLMLNYFSMMATNGTGPEDWSQNYLPMAGPSSSVSGDYSDDYSDDNTDDNIDDNTDDNSGQPSTSTSAAKPSSAKTEKFYSCLLCSQMNYIKDVPQFRQHIEQHLSPNRPFICEICDKLFTYKSICRNHVMAHCVVEKPADVDDQ